MPIPDHADALARIKSEADQTRETVKSVADLAASFFTILVANGLEEDQALALTQTWLTTTLSGAAQSSMLDEVLKAFGMDGSGE
jgi:putative heme degradation protein